MLYQVRDLSPEQKQAAEILLGHSISEDEAVSIKSFNPSMIVPSKLSSEERISALRALEERFAKVVRPGVSEEEEDTVANEALRSSRPNYRPIV
jgi:hypothetical protein